MSKFTDAEIELSWRLLQRKLNKGPMQPSSPQEVIDQLD